MPFTAAIIGAGASVGGALIGADQANKNRSAANDARANALAQYAGIELPSIEEQQLLLDQYTSTGVLTPQLEALLNLGPSAYEGISLDPTARAAQVNSLAKMGEIAQQGVTPEDKAVYELIRRNVAGEAEAKQQQIMQNMQSRGVGGSGAELATRLISSQNSADRLQQAQLEEAAKKQQARMQALTSQANMAGNLRNSDYSEASNVASAKDKIAAFNTQNAQALNTRNTDRANSTNQYNVSNNQRLADNNVNMRNQQQQHNKGLLQQNFSNQMNLANAKAGQYGNQAQAQDTQAGQTASMWAGVGQGVGTIMGGMNKTSDSNSSNSSNNSSVPSTNSYNLGEKPNFGYFDAQGNWVK